MFNLIFVIIAFQWIVINANDQCDKNVTNILTGKIIPDYNDFCKRNSCINKFCSEPNTVLFHDGDSKIARCITKDEVINEIHEPFNFSAIEQVYQTDYQNGIKLSMKKVYGDFILTTFNSSLTKNNCTKKWMLSKNVHLLEDGSLLLNMPNHSPRFQIISQQDFIVEYHIFRSKMTKKWVGLLGVRTIIKETEKEKIGTDYVNQICIGIGFLISSFFLIILFVIYCMFRQLRNLAGLILMAYVASFTIGIIIKAVHIFTLLNRSITSQACLYTSIIKYFCILSSFLWMNVMAFDIWWTFRGSVKARPINRRGIMHKFTMYCLYAFGIPFLMTVGAIIIDTLPSDNKSSNDIKKPLFDACMNSKGNNLFYIYVPVMIIITANIILFIMTSFNIWRLKKDNDKITKCSESRTNQRDQNRFFLYIRLSLITGVHWILDVIDMLVDENMPYWLKIITNTYSVLIGVFIFAIFICRKNILYIICVRFNIFRKFSESLYPNRSVKSTDTTNRSTIYKRVDSVAMEPLPSTID